MKLISVDFQGCPVCAKTLMEVLTDIGFEVKDDKLVLDINEKTKKFLSAYPRILKDDGMGYGIDPMYITEIDMEVYEDDICGVPTPVFNIFREKDFSDKIEHKEDFEPFIN